MTISLADRKIRTSLFIVFLMVSMTWSAGINDIVSKFEPVARGTVLVYWYKSGPFEFLVYFRDSTCNSVRCFHPSSRRTMNRVESQCRVCRRVQPHNYRRQRQHRRLRRGHRTSPSQRAHVRQCRHVGGIRRPQRRADDRSGKRRRPVTRLGPVLPSRGHGLRNLRGHPR